MRQPPLTSRSVRRQLASLMRRKQFVEAEIDSLRRRCKHDDGSVQMVSVYGYPCEYHCSACRRTFHRDPR